MQNNFYREHEDDKTLWVDIPDSIGELSVSFDGKKIYNLFTDYPEKFSVEEKRIFDEENPFWVDFFSEED